MGDWFQDPVDSKTQGCSRPSYTVVKYCLSSLSTDWSLGLLESTDGGMEGQLQWVKCF